MTMIGQARGYVSVGFGETYGRMAPADVIAGWLDGSGGVVVSDRKNPNGYDTAMVDPVQSATAVRGSYSNGVTSVTFTRKLSKPLRPLDCKNSACLGCSSSQAGRLQCMGGGGLGEGWA